MARSTAVLMEEVAHLDPRAAAERLVQAQRHRAGWLDAFAEHLDRQRNAEALERILSVWGLNQSDAARLFGVSRQAISKWLRQGVPAERAETVGDLAAATDLLVRHIQRDRIAAVVRRRAPALGDLSLLDLLEQQRSRDVLAACRAMFAFAEVHA